jgi:hypothetical protein
MPSEADGSVLYRLEKAPSIAVHLRVQNKKDLHGKRDTKQSIYSQYKETTNMEAYLNCLERNNNSHLSIRT